MRFEAVSKGCSLEKSCNSGILYEMAMDDFKKQGK